MTNRRQVTISEFLSAFFPKMDEVIYLRAFKTKRAPDKADNYPIKEGVTRHKLSSDSDYQNRLVDYNKTRGIYFVVNSGGNTQESITRFNAFFAEADERSIEEQHAALDASPLLPSIRVETLRSVHAYWLLKGGCSREEWKEVQARLASYFKGDMSLKNLDRCMRLPHFYHVEYHKESDSLSYKKVVLAEFNKELRYTTQEMLEAFPVSEKGEKEKKSMRKVLVNAGSQFSSREERNSELAQRIMGHPTAKLNAQGLFDCQGICHNGVGHTALMYNPATGTVHCNKGCDYFTILRAFGLPNDYLPSPNSSNSQFRNGDNSEKRAFPMLDRKALYGLAGDFVKIIHPHTESDEAALLVQLLTGFGNIVGRTGYYVADGARHYTNLYALIIGKTSAAKGSAQAHVMNLLKRVDATWAETRVKSGLSSGEGLIKAVDDADNPTDRRLLVVESEFASVLHMNSRESNTLSSVMRNLWDKGSGATMTKKDAVSTTNAHVSIVGHITPEELERYLTPTEIANGYANRFIFACVQRSKDLPEGGNLTEEEAESLIGRFIKAVNFAQGVGEMKRDEEARQLWSSVYPSLVADRPGNFGKVTARARAQVLRLSLIYALLDCSVIIRRVHMEAALALWEFCEDSAAYHFSGSALSEKAQKLLNAIRGAGEAGLNKTEMYELFGRKVKKTELESLLSEVESTGAVRSAKRATEGRDEERWFALSDEAQDGELREEDEESQRDGSDNSSNSHNSPSGDQKEEEEKPTSYSAVRVPAKELFGSEEKAA